MNKSEMLERLIHCYADGNKARFARIIGVTPQTVSTWIGRKTFNAEILFAKCKGVSAEWLLNGGKGEMLVTQESSKAETESMLQAELTRLRIENDLLREVVGLRKKEVVISRPCRYPIEDEG